VATVLFISATAIIVGNWADSIRRPTDLALLVALALATYLAGTGRFSMPAFQIDVSLVLALAAIVLTGPVGALIVLAIPEMIRPLVERPRVRRIATLSNLASFASQVLVGQTMLVALQTDSSTLTGRWLLCALVATAMVLANVFVTRGIVAGLVDRGLISGGRIELRALAACLALVPFAATTACLIPALGILALVVAAVAETFLRVLVHLVTWRAPAGALTVPEARARYAAALASRMTLSRSERRVLRAAARSGTGRTARRLSTASDRDGAAKALMLAGLWSTGDDCFSRLQPAEMGIESRVLLVAHGWAKLTARGTEQLEHRLALLTLHNNPRRYDRRIVALARELAPDYDTQVPRARVLKARELPRRIAQLKQVA
jgi:riboflavin transporter FmnP